MKPSPTLLHTLDLTEAQLQVLLDLDDPGSPEHAANRRSLRQPYRVSEGIIVEAAGDCARVAPRDLSSDGIGFLHRGLLPAGTDVVVLLPIPGRGPERTVGMVVRCYGLTRDIFDVGVAFAEPIDIEPILAAIR